ncbi:hypothetical protein MD588_24775 [Photobacterium sp. SDRW27]|uniref:hypothetical protein n=1 Tax=Photobacterium obscurum TaxID=2829490 RepID=UPI002243D5BE|nr:hypothetical protein [Photobacterium obscurum]MCW8332012.1 hypothetical protein [Photobacterium obscurum]
MIQLGRNGIQIDKEPEICPVCNSVISPLRTDVLKEMWKDQSSWSNKLDVIYECPSAKCGHLFIAHYKRKSESEGSINAFHSFSHSSPQKFMPPKLDDKIIEISPSFSKIYNQAASAEASELTEICGIGYRKALEFLIKDFCLSEHTEDESKIKNMPLMQCINKYVSDVNIKECATRAVWLGNDETHYERKWVSRDIEDLKLLINLVIHWTVSSLLTKEYMGSMQRT